MEGGRGCFVSSAQPTCQGERSYLVGAHTRVHSAGGHSLVPTTFSPFFGLQSILPTQDWGVMVYCELVAESSMYEGSSLPMNWSSSCFVYTCNRRDRRRRRPESACPPGRSRRDPCRRRPKQGEA